MHAKTLFVCIVTLLMPFALALPTNETEVEVVSTLSPRAALCLNNPRMPAALVRGCIDDLRKRGTTPCFLAPGENAKIFCDANGSVIRGYRALHVPSSKHVSSYCSDVAKGMEQVMSLCTQPNLDGRDWVGGENAAWGNGDLIARITSRNV